MIYIKTKFPKFQVFEYDSRRGHIPNNLAMLNENFSALMGPLLRRDLALAGDSDVLVFNKEKRVFMSQKYAIMYTIQKFGKKRIDSGRKRAGDRGRDVTKFIVAYPSHIVVRCHFIPKKAIKSYYQHMKHFNVELYSYAELVGKL